MAFSHLTKKGEPGMDTDIESYHVLETSFTFHTRRTFGFAA